MNDEIHLLNNASPRAGRDCESGGEHAAVASVEMPSSPTAVLSETSVGGMSALLELGAEGAAAVARVIAGGTSNVQDVYPLSPLQEGILFHHLLNEQSDTYVLSTLFELRSRSEVDRLIEALRVVVDRHDILRTAVFWEGTAHPVQIVCRRVELPIEVLTLAPDRDPIAQLTERMTAWSQRMDLRRAPLLRLTVAEAAERLPSHALLQVHHIACDHQSLQVVVAEVMQCLAGCRYDLPAPVAFRQYVAQSLAELRTSDAQAFFHSKLQDVAEPTAPFGLVDIYGDGSHLEEAREELSPFLAQEVRRQAKGCGVSPARVFHAAWSLVTAFTSGKDDIVFGTVLSNARQRSAHGERMLGLSVNTLPLRLSLQGVGARELLDLTHRELKDLLSHQATPLTLAQRCANTGGNMPLFTSLLNFRRSRRESEPQALDGVRVLARGEAWTNYPVSLTVDDCGEGFTLISKADRRVGPRRVMRFLTKALESLLRALDRSPQAPALKLDVLPDEERYQVIDLFNRTQAPYPHDKLIHELFEEEVLRRPNDLAVVGESQTLSFNELNQRANQLARYLRGKGVTPDCRVAICLGRTVEMLVAVLGTLKAGGAYVPLDPEYPSDRVAYMLGDAAPVVILTERIFEGALPPTPLQLVFLDEEWGAIAARSPENLDKRELELLPDHLAYIIYTSGSTGRPKGVMIEHRNLASLWQGLEHIYRESLSCRRVAINASFTFDASVKQLVQLLSGRTIVLVPQECRWDASLLLGFMREHRVDAIDCTPGQLRAWLRAGLLTSVSQHKPHVVLVGGEPIDADLWATLASSVETVFYNVYGPTESTVDTTFARLREDTTAPHIGHPMENRRVYILNHHGSPTAIGVAGEMYIAGAGIARGYLNRPDHTNDRFLIDPFSSESHARMYRSGDLARWRADGKIEYLGRNDHQVKVRGYRIELGEIETQLLQRDDIAEAVVIVRNDEGSERRLVAYVVARDTQSHAAVTAESLRKHLKSELPEYMVPSAFVVLERMPLTPNGKLDRNALPAPQLDAYVTLGYEAPRGDVEEIVAAIWQSLLRIERVGRRDNFFELGGHSLLIMQMLERLRHVGLSAEVRRVFESPTVADLARVLTSQVLTATADVPENLVAPGCERITSAMLPMVALHQDEIDRIVQAVPGGASNVQDIYPLDPLQEGILFHHLLNEGRGDTYIVSIVLSVATRARLDDLILALQSVINRHDILRTAIFWEQLPTPVQVVCRRAALPVEERTLDPKCGTMTQIKEWIRPDRQQMNLACAPLIRLLVADAGDGRWYAVLQSHHITSDHVTLEIVTSEVVAHMDGYAQTLPEPVPYRNHIAQVLANARKLNSEAFFRAKLGDIDRPTAPFALLDVRGDGTRTREVRQPLSLDLAGRARTVARRLGVSAATLFHAAWGLVVAHTAGCDDVVFGSVLLGRLQGGAGVQRILGMFINTLPVRIRLQNTTARQLVEQTQRELIELLTHEQASLAAAQRCSGLGGAAPLFTSLFNYRHSAPVAGASWFSARGVDVVEIQERTNYPIAFTVDDLGEEFALTAQVDVDVDPTRVISYMEGAFESLIAALERAPNTLALDLTVLPAGERYELDLFNANHTAYPRDRLINELFEEQAQRTPSAVAAVYGNQSLTYEQLDLRANQLASYLVEQGVGQGSFIPVHMSRSLDMLVAQIAVLKCRAVYVPLDPELPLERRLFIFRDCDARMVLADRDWQHDLVIDARWVNVVTLADALNCRVSYKHSVQPNSRAPAYVMYTSGSTGIPKGVIVPHCAVNHLVINNTYAQVGPDDCIAHHSNPAFDASTFEVWGALLNGARVVILPQVAVLDPHEFAQVLKRENVTMLYMSVGLFTQYAEVLQEAFRNLRYLMVGGESLVPGAIRRVLRDGPPQRFLNAYGPTECTTFSTTHLIEEVSDSTKSIPIGRPIANARIHILSSRLQPVPIGAIGEMYIGGAGVACGYLNRPELTAQRFIPDPFSTDRHARLYRTGDLARWRDDGVIEFFGRNDQQVKIRGFRVELGEIEAQIRKHPEAKEAVVLAREDVPGEKRLVGYVVAKDSSASVDIGSLRDMLRGALPEYMVPGAFVKIAEIPLTSSGKVNRRALPPPAIADYAGQEYSVPQGNLESALSEIWRQLLAVERIGRNDNFFDLGGHSLLALQAVSKMNQALGSALKVTDLYANPTVAELATRIDGGAAREELVHLTREAHLDSQLIAKPSGRLMSPRGILLTGATGFVGRFLLSQLLRDTDRTIYCLVRAQSERHAALRIRATLSKWDLWCEEFDGRVVAVPGDLRLPQLGMNELAYRSMCRLVGSVYHCGTSMNHLETYARARTASVDGSRELLKFTTCEEPKQINYISTLAIFRVATTHAARVVDESTSIDDERHFAADGYAASKWVADKLFMTASQRGIPCNIFRLGLVWADTEQGRYDELQRDYRLIKTCLMSGYGIKDYCHALPPTPVDYVARAILALAVRYPEGGRVFHISSPDPSIAGIFERCNEVAETSLELVPYYEWVQMIKRIHQNGTSLPAVPLLEFAFSLDRSGFYERLNQAKKLSFDCARTRRALEEAGIQARVLNHDLLRKCIRDMLTRDPELQSSDDTDIADVRFAKSTNDRMTELSD